MNEMNKVTDKILDEIIDTEDKNIEITFAEPLNTINLMAIEGIKNLEDPFEMLSVKDIMKDLDICKNMAYKVFQRDDFPSVSVGKQHKIMLIAYIIWKMQKRV